jgi:hypothetical protein
MLYRHPLFYTDVTPILGEITKIEVRSYGQHSGLRQAAKFA